MVQDKPCEPLISPQLQRLRPFLAMGDFAPGSFGHALVDALQPADIAVEKVAFSAFYMSRLEFVLRRIDIDCLICAGIVTNGDVAATIRDAHVRELDVVSIEDGCATFKPETHRATVASLGHARDIVPRE